MQNFNSFNIRCVLGDENYLVDSLEISTSPFNVHPSFPNDFFLVELVYLPSIPNNERLWKIFHNDEHILNLLMIIEGIEEDSMKNSSIEPQSRSTKNMVMINMKCLRYYGKFSTMMRIPQLLDDNRRNQIR
jgi:hypothetical protein